MAKIKRSGWLITIEIILIYNLLPGITLMKEESKILSKF